MEKREFCGFEEEGSSGFAERRAAVGGVEGETGEGRESCRGSGHYWAWVSESKSQSERDGRLIPKPELGQQR